jgi:hypothetical protein
LLILQGKDYDKLLDRNLYSLTHASTIHPVHYTIRKRSLQFKFKKKLNAAYTEVEQMFHKVKSCYIVDEIYGVKLPLRRPNSYSAAHMIPYTTCAGKAYRINTAVTWQLRDTIPLTEELSDQEFPCSYATRKLIAVIRKLSR